MTRGEGGGPPPDAIVVRLCELLESRGGAPVEREWLIREAGKVIPPGVAIRRTEQVRKIKAGRVAPAQRYKTASDERLIQIGRRSLVVARMEAMKARLQRRTDENGVQWVRLVSLPPRVVRERERLRANMADTANPEETAQWHNG